MNGLIAHALIRNDDSILILKRNKWRKGNRLNAQPEKWDFPGGTVEKGELPRDAVVREVMEETGIEVEVNRILYEFSNVDSGKGKVFTTLVYECRILGDFQVNINEEEHSKYEWVNIKLFKLLDYELVNYVIPALRELVLCQYNGQVKYDKLC